MTVIEKALHASTGCTTSVDSVGHITPGLSRLRCQMSTVPHHTNRRFSFSFFFYLRKVYTQLFVNTCTANPIFPQRGHWLFLHELYRSHRLEIYFWFEGASSEIETLQGGDKSAKMHSNVVGLYAPCIAVSLCVQTLIFVCCLTYLPYFKFPPKGRITLN